jgi:hypothetical protein
VVIAPDQDVLASYLASVKKRKEVSRALTGIAEDYSFAPFVMVGSLFKETEPSTSERPITVSNKLWYGIAIDRKGDKLNLRMTIPGKMGPKSGPSWGLRLLMWGFGLIKLFAYLTIIVAFASLIYRTAHIIRHYRSIS